MNKSNISSIAFGFLLGAATILVLGQSSPPQTAIGRYNMITTGTSIFVQDSTTGEVKMIPAGALNFGTAGQGESAIMDLGSNPF